METRKLILLMIFSISCLMLWDNYQASQGRPTILGIGGAPVAEQPAVEQAQTPSDLPAPASDLPQVADSAQKEVPSKPVAQAPAAEVFTIKTDVLELDFSTQGAQLVGSRLLDHPDAINPEQPVSLFTDSSSRTYLGQIGVVGAKGAPNHRMNFELVSNNLEFTQGQKELDLVLQATGNGVSTEYVYTISRDSYIIDIQARVTNNSLELLNNPSVYMQITRDGSPLESDSSLYATFTGPAVYSPEKKYQKIDFDDIADGSADYQKTSNDGWLAMVQHYFVSAMVPPEGPREYYTRQVGTNLYSVGMVSPLGNVAPGETVLFPAHIYTGPQDQRTLEGLAQGLDLVVDYGWLTVVAQPIFWLLEHIHALVGNWGWAIIALTVLIKAVFFPLSAASYKSMAKMRAVGPRMQKMKEQYGDDKMGFQRAMMDMYKREKINPLGGCMP
ncbi:MAG: membrane protein insertase YidC, partial [Limnobacter sp.]|nr:membrane protein insertase YidC [Limnobacter sp.]